MQTDEAFHSWPLTACVLFRAPKWILKLLLRSPHYLPKPRNLHGPLGRPQGLYQEKCIAPSSTRVHLLHTGRWASPSSPNLWRRYSW